MLELSKIAGQIDDMGREFASRAARERRALPAAQELLRQFAGQQEALREVAQSEDGRRLWCASPGDERLDVAFPAQSLGDSVTLVAADGSQIFPDQHGLAWYYLVNVGSIVLRVGSARAPQVATLPRIVYADAEVYPDGRPVSADLVSAERSRAEMQVLADLCEAEGSAGSPPVAFADGPLLLWLQWEEHYRERQTKILEGYLACLDTLRKSGACVSGFVSRPRSAEVMALLYLAQLPPEERGTVRSLAETGFRGLTDRALFGHLRPGERSALFVRGIRANEAFRARGHSIFFFYLNTQGDVARVEVPEWVARNGDQVARVQAAVFDQCLRNRGYPYVLTRADEQAVILGEEREALEGMLLRAMARHGLPVPELSRKAQQKQVARWRKHR